MEFRKICPNCLKTYTNGAIGKCGKCQVNLREIGAIAKRIVGNNIFIQYKFIEKETKKE